ncbi:acyltransferase family protein [Bradyrhizobium sp. STM 3562]|uniref:acyltransferase family protein n=1 Tax=Bradyrhizobium sp. STM 3562 TaxID=578924 RepID=UPI00388E3354
MVKTSTLPGTDRPGTDKLLGLEGLRFLATFGVLLWHYQHFAFVGSNPVGFVRSALPFYGVFFPLYEAGRYGVWMFWCISGFIFFWKYREAISDRSIGGWAFFVFRVSRLYPLHFATLLLVALLQPLYHRLTGVFFVAQNNDLPHFIAQLFLASDWTPQRSDSFNAPIWSVSVEVLIYAAFFLTLRFVTKSPLFNLVVVLACLNGGTQVAACLAFFYAGGLAAIGRRFVAHASYKRAIELTALVAMIAVPIATAILSLSIEIVDWVLLLAYTPVLLFWLSAPMTLPVRLERLFETAGNMTYSCYLLHFPIQLAIALCFALAQQPIPYYSHLFWAAFVLPTLLASHVTYRYFEAPAQRLIRSALLRKQRAGRTSPAPL